LIGVGARSLAAHKGRGYTFPIDIDEGPTPRLSEEGPVKGLHFQIRSLAEKRETKTNKKGPEVTGRRGDTNSVGGTVRRNIYKRAFRPDN